MVGGDVVGASGPHDAARSDTDRSSSGRNVTDHHRRRRARDAGHIVMLSKPEPLKAQLFGVLRQTQRIIKRLSGRRALIDRRQIEDRERYVRKLFHCVDVYLETITAERDDRNMRSFRPAYAGGSDLGV